MSKVLFRIYCDLLEKTKVSRKALLAAVDTEEAKVMMKGVLKKLRGKRKRMPLLAKTSTKMSTFLPSTFPPTMFSPYRVPLFDIKSYLQNGLKSNTGSRTDFFATPFDNFEPQAALANLFLPYLES